MLFSFLTASYLPNFHISLYIRTVVTIDVTTENKVTTISSKTFIFEQGIPATEWIINHNLNKRPNVVLTDTSGVVFESYKEYPSNNQVIVYLEGAMTGFAYLN